MLQDACRIAAASDEATGGLAVDNELVTAVSLANPLLRVAIQAGCIDDIAAALFEQLVQLLNDGHVREVLALADGATAEDRLDSSAGHGVMMLYLQVGDCRRDDD